MAKPHIDLAHLRLFVQVAELDTFTEAAATLGIAQPTISRVVKQLEDAWGGLLFHRTPRGVTLSELGQAAATRARALLREADQVSDDLRAFGGRPSGTVSLGVSPSLAPAVVPHLVNELRREAPGIRLQVHEGFSHQIEAWRLAGTVDIGIAGTFSEGGSDVPGELFASHLVLAAASTSQPLPPEISFADLADYPLVMPPSPNGLRRIFEDVARRHQITLDVVVETESIGVQKQVCAQCGCYSVKAPETIAEEIASGTYTAAVIIDPMIRRHVTLETTQQRPLSRAAREVADRVTDLLTQLSP